MLDEQTAKRMNLTHFQQEAARELGEGLRFEQVYLANVSPFLVFFWGANLALLGIIYCVPLGTVRLGFALSLCGLMLVVLIVHACLGMPLERRMAQIIAERIYEGGSKEILLMAFKNSKTVWFWLTLTSVFLLATIEPLLNSFRPERLSAGIAPVGITAATTLLAIIGVSIQFALRQTIVSEMENRMAQLRQAEERKRQRAEERATRLGRTTIGTDAKARG